MSLRPRYSLLTLLLLTALVAGGVKLWYGPHHVVERVSVEKETEYTFTRDWFGNRIIHGPFLQRTYDSSSRKLQTLSVEYYRSGMLFPCTYTFITDLYLAKYVPPPVEIPKNQGLTLDEQALWKETIIREEAILTAQRRYPIGTWFRRYQPGEYDAVSVKLWNEPPYDTLLVWKWSESKASLAYSTEQHLPDYDVELTDEGFIGSREGGTLKIRSKHDGKLIYSYQKYASEHTVFTRWQNILYVAEYRPIITGCEVVAVDLKSGKELWRTNLYGIGPFAHTKQKNSVNIETDGEVIIVAGNEEDGRYVEHLKIKNGKILANKKFAADP